VSFGLLFYFILLFLFNSTLNFNPFQIEAIRKNLLYKEGVICKFIFSFPLTFESALVVEVDNGASAPECLLVWHFGNCELSCCALNVNNDCNFRLNSIIARDWPVVEVFPRLSALVFCCVGRIEFCARLLYIAARSRRLLLGLSLYHRVHRALLLVLIVCQ